MAFRIIRLALVAALVMTTPSRLAAAPVRAGLQAGPGGTQGSAAGAAAGRGLGFERRAPQVVGLGAKLPPALPAVAGTLRLRPTASAATAVPVEAGDHDLEVETVSGSLPPARGLGLPPAAAASLRERIENPGKLGAPDAVPLNQSSPAKPAERALNTLARQDTISGLDLPGLFDRGEASAEDSALVDAFLPAARTRLLQWNSAPGAKAESVEHKAVLVAQHALRDTWLMDSLLKDDPAWTGRDAASDRRLASTLALRLGHFAGIRDLKAREKLVDALVAERSPTAPPLAANRPGRARDSLMRVLREEAAAMATVPHAREIMRRGMRLYRRFFPRFYREVPFDMLIEPSDRISGLHDVETAAFHSIALQIDQPVTAATEEIEGGVTFPREIQGRVLGLPIQRRVSTLLIFLHEYAHAIFAETVLAPEQRPRRTEGAQRTAFDALTEGFAVMLELLAIDKMVAARAELRLSGLDVENLLRMKRMRILSLRVFNNHYTTGTLKFFHKVYKREGEAGMLRLLKSLDGRKLNAIQLNDPAFRAAWGKPEHFEKLLAK